MIDKKQQLNARKVYRRARTSPEMVRVITMLHPDVVRAIDDWGIKRGALNRTAAIRRLLQIALETEKAPGVAAKHDPDASAT